VVKTKLEIISKNTQFKKFFGVTPLMAASVRVTKACNLKCSHCYANGGCPLKGELTTKEMLSVVDQFANLGVLHIFYTGGEPFLRKDIVSLLQYTDKKGLGILISTNGQLVTSEKLNQIKSLNIKLFQISLDGTKKTHTAIRGKNTYERSIKLIRTARETLGKNVAVGSVMMKNNWEEMDRVLGIAAKNGADIFSLMLLIVSGRASESINPTPAETLKSIDNIFKSYEKHRSVLKFANNTTIPAALVPKKFRRRGLHETFALCSFPYCLGVESNGDVAACDGFFNSPEMIIGNIRESSLAELWNNSPIMNDIRKINPTDLKGVCRKCVYRDYCAGGCRASAYNKYKDLTMPDPVCQTIYEAGLFPKDCLVR